MLIYALCAIFTVLPCPSLSSTSSATNGPVPRVFNTPSVDNIETFPDVQAKDKRDIWAILNPFRYNNAMDNDKSSSETQTGVFIPQIPKITVWEFPTERRAFINDMEIFIKSNEDEKNSDETDGPQNEYIKHPHDTDYKNLDKDVIEEEKYPAFRPRKIKRENNPDSNAELQQNVDEENDEIIKYIHYLNEKSAVYENTDVNDDDISLQHKNQYLDVIAQHLLRPSRKKRCIQKKEMTIPINKLIDENDSIANASKGITYSMRAFYEYLKWLLSNTDSSIVSDLYSPKPNVDSQEGNDKTKKISVIGQEIAEANGLEDNNQQSGKGLLINTKTLSTPKVNAEILKGTNRGVALLPVHPEILSALLKDMEKN